jgi:hypothetical protein
MGNCRKYPQVDAWFQSGELSETCICATFRKISHVLHGGAAKLRWTVLNRAGTLLITPL